MKNPKMPKTIPIISDVSTAAGAGDEELAVGVLEMGAEHDQRVEIS